MSGHVDKTTYILVTCDQVLDPPTFLQGHQSQYTQSHSPYLGIPRLPCPMPLHQLELLSIFLGVGTPYRRCIFKCWGTTRDL